MSEACYTAKATLRTASKDLVSGLSLQRNNNGQYQHDAIMLFKTGIERKLAEIYNPLVPGEGMKQLLIQTPNLLNSIKSTDNKTPDEILRSAKYLRDQVRLRVSLLACSTSLKPEVMYFSIS